MSKEIKSKGDYKYALVDMTEKELCGRITGDAVIHKAEYVGDDLHIYVDSLWHSKTPVVKADEFYCDCLLVIKGARLCPLDMDDVHYKVSQKRLDELKGLLTRRSLYMSFSEFMANGSEDVTIDAKDGRLKLMGYGAQKDYSSLWAIFELDYDSVSYYFDEICDYMTGETIG